MQEEWRPVVGFEEHYEVSNLGRVRSLPWPGHHNTEVVMKTFRQNSGYLVVTLRGGKKKLVHRIVAEAFLSGQMDGLYVNHIDGDKTNNCVQNLEWTTPKENCEHSIKILKHSPGKKPRAIRCIDDGKIYCSAKDVAEKMGVKPITVYVQIKNGGTCGGKRFVFC